LIAIIGYNEPTLRIPQMRFSRLLMLSVLVILSFYSRAQQAASLSPAVQKYVRVSAPKVVLEHVRVIDGTGQAPLENQNVLIEGGKIIAVQPAADTADAGNRWHAQPPFLRRAAG
jgi:hypothetical protein